MIRDFCRCLVKVNSLADHELKYLYYRLGMQGSEYPEILNPTIGEALEALAILVKDHPAVTHELISNLQWFAQNLLSMESVCPVASWMEFIGAALIPHGHALPLLEDLCDQLLQKQGQEVAKWSEAVRALLRAGIKPPNELVVKLLRSPLFNLPAFLHSVPKGSSVEEVLSRHYGLLLDLLNLANPMADPIIWDYLSAIEVFLEEAQSLESFLLSVMKRCLELLTSLPPSLRQSLMQPRITHGPMLQALLPSMALARVRLCKCTATDLLNALADLKESLSWLVLHPSPDYQLERLAGSLGQAMGEALKQLVQVDRQAASAFVTNLTSIVALKHDQAVAMTVAVLGSVAVSVSDDQYRQAGQVPNRAILDQFNRVAVAGSPSYLNVVLNVHQAVLTASHETFEHKRLIASALECLASELEGQDLKREILMHAAIKMLVDTALQQVPSPHNRKQKKLESMTVPSEIGLLLPVIGGCVNSASDDASSSQSLRVETFQNLWLVLIFCAHIPLRFTWPADWLPHLRAVAEASPVLIQGRDRLQTTENALSRTLLGEAALSQQMRNHLTDHLLSGDAKLVRQLSMAQSLWILAVHECERFRTLQSRPTANDHLLRYVQDTLIHALNLTEHLQQLSERLLIQWLSSHFNSKVALGYCQQLVSMHGHAIESVHRFANRMLVRLCLDLAPQLATERGLWQDLLRRLDHLHQMAVHEMGQPDGDFDSLLDPGYAREAFATLLDTTRKVFNVASMVSPHTFYSFASHPPSETVAQVELMRQCLPIRSDEPDEYWKPGALASLNYLAGEDNIPGGFPQDAEQMKKACLSWSHANEIEVLAQIAISLCKLRREQVPRSKPHPFKMKMSFNPSKAIPSRQSAPWPPLIDFLEERSLLKPSLHLYRALWDHLLVLVEDRHSLFRLCLWMLRRGKEREVAIVHDRMVRFFEGSAQWRVQSKELLIQEMQLMEDLEAAMERHRTERLNVILMTLIKHERERLAVWLGIPKAALSYHSPAELQRWLRAVLPASKVLGMRLVERFSIHNGHEAFEADKQIALHHDLLLFYLHHGLPIDTSTLLFAPTGYLVSALMILGHDGLSQEPVWCNYALRTLESINPDALFFYTPQIVQLLRRDKLGYVERVAMHIARQSSLFAHQMIWNLMANTHLDDAGQRPDPCKDLFEGHIQRIQHLFTGDSLDFYQREFEFFRRVTGISGALKPLVKREKWEKKRKIDEELAKIRVDAGVYLPSSPESIVEDIDYDSGRPLQSHAKVS